MLYVRTAYRLIGFIFITLTAAVLGILFKLMRFRHNTIFRFYLFWKRGILWVMNIQVQEEGTVPSTPGVIMANHRSYVDIAVTPSIIPFVIVAKKSVRSWPLVGLGGDAIRTIWVDRESKDSRTKTREKMNYRLGKGGSVLIYPEGTTSKGPGLLDLKPGMFHTCADGNFPIYPMAIEYEDQDIAWVGDDLFIPHFISHFGQKRVRVKVRYGEPILESTGEELRIQTYNWLSTSLNEMRQEWDEQSN